MEAVEDGKAALAAIAGSNSTPFDVVVMDLQMPEMGGLEATQAVRQREAGTGRRVPIVALTAHVRLREDLSVSRSEEIGRKLQELVDARWHINHAVFQFEVEDAERMKCEESGIRGPAGPGA